MNTAELDRSLLGPPIARHRGECFFTSYDRDEAEGYVALGASLRLLGGRGAQAWEVHVAGMLDEHFDELDDGTRVDLRPADALAHFRERDGFSLSFMAPRGGGDG